MGDKTIEEVCPRCGSSEIIFDAETGEEVCSICGMVIREEVLERESKPDVYQHEGRPEKGMERLSPETSRKMRRLLRYDMRVRQEALGHRKMGQAKKELDRLIDGLHLPRSIRERALTIYSMALERDLIIRGTIAGFVAASLYAACREAEIPRTLHEVSEKSTDDIKEVGRMYRLLLTELKLRMPVDDPIKFVPRIAAEMGVRQETDQLTIEILREAMKQKALAGKDPRAMAAAALYMACKANEEKCTQAEVAEAAGISEVSLRNRLRDLEEVIEKKDDMRENIA